jgi:hypothetical protein
MADLRIADLVALASAGPADILPIVSDPTGTPITQRITVAALLSAVWPVGSVYASVVPTSPATLFGFGAWAAIGAGRVLVGVDPADATIDAAEKTAGAKTATPDAHSGAAVGNHASHVHSIAGVLNHTHPVAVTDPGHAHLTQRYPTATGTSSGFTIDTSMSGTLAANTLPVQSSPTGITAVANNPAGGAATLNTGNEAAALTHSVTQPSAHAALSVVQPALAVYFWKRTA